MASKQTPRAKERRTRRGPGITIGFGIVIVLIALSLFLSSAFEQGEEPARGLPTFVTQRGPMTISVIESGTIKARDQIVIKNGVEGKSVIIRLVAEGTMVKKGQPLFTLDKREYEAQMMQAQKQLGQESGTVSVGGGAVTVVMTGQQELRSVKISPDAANPEDVEMLQDLILAAVNEATAKSRDLAEQKMAPLTGALNIPGLM